MAVAPTASSNRTFMELKLLTENGEALLPRGSNRTFMELKLRELDAVECDCARSNRTFMELKSDYLEVRMKAIFEF